ncbi:MULTISPECIES: 4'-phosphopantetheinyl transferase superfamily protein [unclassified Agrococcus]|uniref:4'-phosphopantetheinyl transferase superfamily protein n=1 Tax=unclassified Agrococcus TaxID=2615065 RepID=UPI00360660E0
MSAVEPADLDVDARWLPAETTTTDALRMLGAMAAGHACPRCGSDEHGMPWARSRHGRLAASAARSGGRLLIATRAAELGTIGVDVEGADVVLDASVVLHDDELDSPLAGDLAWAWTAKEAIVKHLGSGLRTEPASIRIRDFAVHRIPAPPGMVAALCTGAARAR